MDGLSIEYQCKDDVVRRMDIGQVVGNLGFHYQQRVTTPLGLGTVLGVNCGHLYFLLDSDAKASCWSDCHTAHDFRERNILPYDAPAPHHSTVCSGGVQSEYHNLKKIQMGDHVYQIVMQSVNGPCPVIALANALILRGELHDIVPTGSTAIAATSLRGQLLSYLKQSHPAPSVAPSAPSKRNESPTLVGLVRERLEELRRELLGGPDAEALLLRFYGGLDVSPIFSHPDGFDAEEKHTVLFALGGVRLVHGWIYEESHRFAPLRNLSYTEVQVKMFDTDDADGAAMAAELTNSSEQLTVAGLAALHETLCEGEVCVQFYNNHFSTVTKRNGGLLRLLSDVSFVDRSCMVFEEVLDNQGRVEYVDGDGRRVDETVLRVQAQYGDKYSDDEILLARAELFSITMMDPTPQDVISKLERRPSAPSIATGSISAAAAGPLMITSGPSSTDALNGSFRDHAPIHIEEITRSPPPVNSGDASRLVDMGLCSTVRDAEQLLRIHGTLQAAVDAMIG